MKFAVTPLVLTPFVPLRDAEPRAAPGPVEGGQTCLEAVHVGRVYGGLQPNRSPARQGNV